MRFPAGTRIRVALIYPNSYYIGMSNLGFHIIYDLLNRRGDIACERFFLPDRDEIQCYEKTNTPLMSIETQTPLYEFSILAFAVSFEMDYFNILKILSLGKVQALAALRTEKDAFLIAGGPCPTFNPEPLSAIFDAFVIGEGEVIVPPLMDAVLAAVQDGQPRDMVRRAAAGVPGVYVPALYEHIYDEEGRLSKVRPKEGAPEKVSRQWVQSLDAYPAHTVIVTEDTEFNFYLIETARGCGRHCRFCMAGYCFRRPRNRSLSVIEEQVRAALPYGKRIGLMGAAISDYPEIDALCRDILGAGLSMSVASFRADSVTEELVKSLADSGLKTITIAPEAGSRRMRAVINKGIEEEHVFHTMRLGLLAGIKNFRLYLMVGLPYEGADDIGAIIDLAGRLKDCMEENGSKGTLTLSINPFIPKPFTPFQWEPMADKKYIETAFGRIRKALRARKHITLNMESPKEAGVQGVLSRGDRKVGEALIKACEMGGSKAFRRAMKELGLDPADYLSRTRGKDEIFPWDILDQGFPREYLYAECERAKRLEATIPCFEGCHRCGVC